MTKGLNLASHATMMAVKPTAAGHAGGEGVVGAGHDEEAHQAADGAGEEHGADDDPAPR